MSVHGYNSDPESGDPCIGVELLTGCKPPVAVIYIEEGVRCTEIRLSYKELWALGGQCKEFKDQMEWLMAEWCYAKGMLANDIMHILRKSDDPHGKTLCGQLPPSWGIMGDNQKAWERSPVLGDPGTYKICKRCRSIYDKATHKQSA